MALTGYNRIKVVIVVNLNKADARAFSGILR